ncbi:MULTISPECIES: non-ribosomal peptide synthetase [unclassified Brenneria]|uniref:non-ribosomal peptide synthetase n=1 Tax=unclassified Brenneria TaxID=2634434 RepID=UPI0018F07A94|nr:non-ribosomal peptide synthetase [Brenneria sp. L3-3C-1]MBJ7223904.1 amino acid adenylation domain-containing protein [Brenneria sp. L3-3C-1]MEE3645149.1 non-ribosomal peptide synthetase [Brenneria sp. L3_3C_1]
MANEMTLVPQKPDLQHLTESLSGKTPKNVRSIWEAFECKGTKSSSLERVEEIISLPNGLTTSIEDLVTTAAMLGALLSTEGRVTVGINVNGVASYLEIDAAELCRTDDTRAYICHLRQTAERVRHDEINGVDIEVTDGQTKPAAQSLVWLSAKDERYVLSLPENRIEQTARTHLCRVASFACARVLSCGVTPETNTLPKHYISEPRQRKSMIERIFKHVQERPTSPAIVDDTCGQTLTYAEVWAASAQLIKQLNEQFPHRSSPPCVALFLDRGWRHLVSIIAVQRMGGTCVLIDPSHPDERIRTFINECDPVAVFSAGSLVSRAYDLANVPVLIINKEYGSQQQIEWEVDTGIGTTNEVCFIAGTSGSTGRPKAVCLSYSGIGVTLDAIINHAGLEERSRGSWLSSPGYGMVEVDPLPILCAGGVVCIPSSEVLQDVRLLAIWLSKQKITHSLVMTSIAEALWAGGGLATDLRTMLIAGERCKQWQPANLNYRVLNVYGSAEAAVVSIEDLSAARRTLLPSVGRAVRGANMYVVDDYGQELPANCVGELIITGETLSVCYLNAEETKKSFHPNKLDKTSLMQYVSGDRARMHLDGTVEIFGRTDTVVKIRGHRVDLTEVEISALEVSGVAKAAATCLSDDTGTTLVLFIEQIQGATGVKDAVRKHLGGQLQPSAQPSQIVTSILPLGSNGKVDYASLQVHTLARNVNQTVFTPITENEMVLRECWLTWTRCDEATFESNFFNSGGDSLRAMRMMGELACQHSIHVEMSSFLENPTLSNLIYLANTSHYTDLPTFKHLPDNQQLEPFNLNESQQALWIGRGADFDYGGVGCQGYFEWEVKDLDKERFERAVGLLVERHSMLRMTIDAAGHQKIGIFHGKQAVKFTDLSQLSQEDIDNEINKIRLHMANEEIGTTQWPLFQFVISQINVTLSRVHFCIDMLIADAWSIFQVIIPDLIDFYFEDNPQLPELKTTFHDYVAYREKVVLSERYRADREYWLKKITTLPVAPKLPQLESGVSDSDARFERYESSLGKETWNRLKAQAQKRNISPSGAIALALCEVLRTWSEEDQFTLNFPVSDRMPVSDDIDSVVGDFTNTLLVPYEASVGDTLEVRGKRLQNAIWEALDHRLFSGVEVLRELSRLRRTGLVPLMPVVLTSLLGHPGRHDVARLGSEVFGVSQTPQVTLDVQIRESEGTLYFKWDYLSGVIRPDVIQAMYSAFCSLLQQLADEPEIWENTRPDLRPPEQIEVRNAVNDTGYIVPQVHLRDLLLERLTKSVNEPAVIDAYKTYTWGELGHIAAYISSQIRQACSFDEQFVGIVLPKGMTQYATVYGCLLAGVGYVPVDIDLPSERIGAMFTQAGVQVAIALPEITLPANIHKIELVVADLSGLAQQHQDIDLPPCDLGRKGYTPYVIFTSGSTGTPKGVEIPEAAVINHIFDVVERFGLNASTRHLASAAFHFDMSVFDIFGPLMHGGSVVVPEHATGPDPDSWLRLIQRHEITFWACVPAVMELVCSVAEIGRSTYAVASVANIVMAGDWIPLSLLPRARTLFPSARLFSCGGPTETTNWSVIHEINEQEGSVVRTVIYGTPMRNSKYHIVANDWSDCPDWVPGEMLVESDISLSCGYIGQPDLTKRTFIRHPRTGMRMYRTGDLGRYLPNGEIEILGRLDNQIKINGFRIELGEIEKVAETCVGVFRACAFSLPGQNGHPKNIALVYLGEPMLESVIIKALTQHLPNYMIPKSIRHVPHLPLSKNGKVDVLALRNALRNEMKEPNITSRKSTLREVIHVISTQLSEPVVLPEDNFFDLGGDSLSATRIKAELEARLSVVIPLENIMLTETIDELANSLFIGGDYE